jgi:hypothetical protein
MPDEVARVSKEPLEAHQEQWQSQLAGQCRCCKGFPGTRRAREKDSPAGRKPVFTDPLEAPLLADDPPRFRAKRLWRRAWPEARIDMRLRDLNCKQLMS